MVVRIADNITSPLGMTTEANRQALLRGESCLRCYDDGSLVPEAFAASMFTPEQWNDILFEGRTRFESLVLYSVREALSHADVDVASDRTCLVLSTTKGNIELIDNAPEQTSPAVAAKHIAESLGMTVMPIVSCNACISGVSAIITAQRLLDCGVYDTAIVCGADVLGTFTVSGFLSLKAVSPEPCRPFDMERIGLNLGEAAATVILGKGEGDWMIANGAICNDAFHITNPSPKGVGSEKAIRQALGSFSQSELAMVNAHGTATMYNDQMESKAIEAAGLSDVPMNALKGYYGHTMGAAGILETVVTMSLLDHGIVLGTRGFEERGVSGKINISGETRTTDKHSFLKMISGFGGCNAALLVIKPNVPLLPSQGIGTVEHLGAVDSHSVYVTPTTVIVDGKEIPARETGSEMLTHIYKNYVGGYPKFYKMDMLSRLGFVATELLLNAEGKERFVECDDRAVILFNSSSSICADREYEESIADRDNWYPSPSVFVYTLPNIVTGEIAMHNKYHGETSFYLMHKRDDSLMQSIIDAHFACTKTRSVIAGWIDCRDNNDFEAELSLIERT